MARTYSLGGLLTDIQRLYWACAPARSHGRDDFGRSKIGVLCDEHRSITSRLWRPCNAGMDPFFEIPKEKIAIHIGSRG